MALEYGKVWFQLQLSMAFLWHHSGQLREHTSPNLLENMLNRMPRMKITPLLSSLASTMHFILAVSCISILLYEKCVIEKSLCGLVFRLLEFHLG